VTPADRAQYGLASPTIPPDLVVTVGDCAPVQEDVTEALRVLRAVRPGVVMLHTSPGPEDVATVGEIRAALPGVRVWIQTPANGLAGASTAKAQEIVRRYVQQAIALGAEVLSFNGEGASAPGRPGWKPGQPLDAGALLTHAHDVLAAAADEAGTRLHLAWSSHDHPQSHALPWAAILGPTSPVALSLPQIYAEPGDGSRCSVAGARARFAASRAQHEALASRGVIRPEFVPGASSCVGYHQTHHHELAALCWLLNQSALAASWTVRADGALCDDVGLLALRVDAELRRQSGHAPGRIERFQAEHGLAVDGLVGPATLRLLGLA